MVLAQMRGGEDPTLDQLLDLAAGSVALNIEIKREAVASRPEGGIEEKVVRSLERKGLVRHAVISSFEPVAIERVKRMNPRQPTACWSRACRAGATLFLYWNAWAPTPFTFHCAD